ncbi:MAG: aldo/keto reductase [Peptococcaceae bacterium]|jgi:predicted aldo/keto reductase-like oxidoreductase|nr:aldo/keto reductase [Peptococcaceae bacterium]
MKYNILGKTGLRVSRLGFGGIPIQRVPAAEAAATIRRCLELGVNFIDTARAYTDSEEKIGQALAGVPRDSYALATKSMAVDGETMTRDIEISLRNLRTDYIDLYQCHNIRRDQDEERLLGPGGGLEALRRAREAGKIRHIGVTGHQVERLIRLLRTGWFETVQVPYNFNETKPEEELLPLAVKENIGVITMKPLGGGALPASLALRFFLDKPVGAIIPGMENPALAEENARCLTEDGPLTPADQADVDRVKAELGKWYCRRCDYCQPCPQGIDIAGVFLFHGYFGRYNMKDWARGRYAGLKVKADACIACGACVGRCPYQLPIPALLRKAAADLAGAI